jgi:serine/threonine protein kinase
MGPYRQVRSRRDALNLEEEAAIKCSAPYRAPELTQVHPTPPPPLLFSLASSGALSSLISDLLVQVSYPCDIGGWCDMWSLGCTMFALAFGRSPFESPKSVIFLRLSLSSLPRLWSLVPSLHLSSLSQGRSPSSGYCEWEILYTSWQ